jgi:hypothetical protein
LLARGSFLSKPGRVLRDQDYPTKNSSMQMIFACNGR